MSAPNFSLRHNTKNIYAFGMSSDYDQYCKDSLQEGYDPCDYDLWSQDEYDYSREAIMEDLHSEFGKYDAWPSDERPNDRDSSTLAIVDASITFAGTTWHVSVRVITTSCYYEGWTVDFETRVFGLDYCDELPELTDLEDALSYDLDNAGLAKMLAPKLQKRLQASYDDLTDRLDAVLSKAATHRLNCCAIFSNGEAIYREVTA